MRSSAREIIKSRRDYSQAGRTSTLSLARIDIGIDTGWRIKLFDIHRRAFSINQNENAGTVDASNLL